MMSRKLAFAVLGFILMISPKARAQSPHFVHAGAELSITDPGDLVVSWKEAGLGANELINYSASATGTATYACVNKGGNHPSASNKETVTSPESTTGSFSSGKNGSITASLTIEEPDPGDFTCSPGHTLVLASVSYTGITLNDTTNSILESLPDRSKVFCDLDHLTKATVKDCVTPD